MCRCWISEEKRTLIFSWLGLGLFIGLLVAALRTTLILIGVAFLIAYILNPLVSFWESKFRKLNRNISSILISLAVLLVIVLTPVIMVPILIEQAKTMVEHLPELSNVINKKLLYPLDAKFNLQLSINPDWLKNSAIPNLLQKNLALTNVMPLAKGSLFALNSIVSIILLPFVLFYVIRDWRIIINYCQQSIPNRYKQPVTNVIRDIDKSLSYYLRGQVMVMILMAIVYAIGLNLIGLPAATIIGLITGFLVFIPYIGFSIGGVLALLMALSNFQGVWQIALVFLVLGIGNLIENFIATPFLVGDSIGLNPIMIIFALIICSNLFGTLGVIASLPLTAIGVVLIKHLYYYYLDSDYYTK